MDVVEAGNEAAAAAAAAPPVRHYPVVTNCILSVRIWWNYSGKVSRDQSHIRQSVWSRVIIIIAFICTDL